MGEEPHAPEGLAGLDPRRLYEQIEEAILGSARTYNRVEVAERAGVDLARATALWRALGFPGTSSDDEVVFTDADIVALRLVAWLVETGFIDPAVELTLVRSMGRSFARLAEWEVSELVSAAFAGAMVTDQSRLEELLASLVPVVEDIQTYIWRRHIASAAGRILLRPATENGVLMGVGFADMVGFTRRTRDLTGAELGRLIETFESVSASIVTEHEGRVIKTIGDEVLFVADDAVAAARIALDLVEARHRHQDFPEVRAGLAHGLVLSRLGDVYGTVVNVASRLTSLATPGRVLVDRGLQEALAAEPAQVRSQFLVRRGRSATVRGYNRLDTWSLRRRPDPA